MKNITTKTSLTSEQNGSDISLQLLLIDENTARAESVASAFVKTTNTFSHISYSDADLHKHVNQLQPDIIFIDIESPSRDILESLHTVKNYTPKPDTMISLEHDINRSIESGVSTYVLGGVAPCLVEPILITVIAKFKEFQKLENELDETEEQLVSRKAIDQAKRLLMNYRNLSDDKALVIIRKIATDTDQKLEDVANTMTSMLNSLP